MADVKWIKITTNMFDNRKIRQIRHLPEGNSIVLIWVMLLTIAGRCNAGGMIFLTENIPYSLESLAIELDFEQSVVKMALKALQDFGMIVCDESHFLISNWEEYQNIEGMEKIREQNRLRKQAQREREKLLPEPMSRDSHVTSQQNHATDIEEEKEVRSKNKDLILSNDSICCTDVQHVINAWNSLNLQRITKIVPDTQRGRWLSKRLRDYGIEQILTAIENVRNSTFLMGDNNKGWQITFDWFIRPNNFPKVLDGNYNKAKLKTDNIFLQMLEDENG